MKKKARLLCMVDLSMVPEALEQLREVADVDYVDADYDVLLNTIGDYHALWGHFDTPVDAAVLDRARRLEMIATATTGTDHIDKKKAAEKKIEIFSIADEYELLERFTATSELAFSLLLISVRKLRPLMQQALAGQWRDKDFEPGLQLSNMTLGVLGFGRLGKMTARYGRAFCQRVLACDIKPFSEVFQGWPAQGIEPVDFDTLLRESDAISIHVHMTPENYHLFDEKVFAKMKEGMVLINTSRGDVIAETALLDALETGRLGAFGTDVLHDEWRPCMAEHPVVEYARNHDNVVITPHIGGATIMSTVEARRFMADKVTAFLRAKACPTPVAWS